MIASLYSCHEQALFELMPQFDLILPTLLISRAINQIYYINFELSFHYAALYVLFSLAHCNHVYFHFSPVQQL